jgi:hypothetical protein
MTDDPPPPYDDALPVYEPNIPAIMGWYVERHPLERHDKVDCSMIFLSLCLFAIVWFVMVTVPDWIVKLILWNK